MALFKSDFCINEGDRIRTSMRERKTPPTYCLGVFSLVAGKVGFELGAVAHLVKIKLTDG
jgi:hypothetical protein